MVLCKTTAMEVLPQVNSIVASEPFCESFLFTRSVLKKNKVENSFPKLWGNEVNAIDCETKAKHDFCKNNNGAKSVVGDVNIFPVKAYPNEEKCDCNQSDCKNGSNNRVSKFFHCEITSSIIWQKAFLIN